MWTLPAPVVSARGGFLRVPWGSWRADQDRYGKRCGLSSCSPAYKCKWENTANQRRTSKLLHRLLILSLLRVHGIFSWFSHVSRWSWRESRGMKCCELFHICILLLVRERWLLHNFLSMQSHSLSRIPNETHSILKNKGLKSCFMLFAWGKTVELDRFSEPLLYVIQTSFLTVFQIEVTFHLFNYILYSYLPQYH